MREFYGFAVPGLTLNPELPLVRVLVMLFADSSNLSNTTVVSFWLGTATSISCSRVNCGSEVGLDRDIRPRGIGELQPTARRQPRCKLHARTAELPSRLRLISYYGRK